MDFEACFSRKSNKINKLWFNSVSQWYNAQKKKTDRENNIDLMVEKFKNSGYDEKILETAKNRALALSREKYYKKLGLIKWIGK